jgi:predicted nucleic acid-binding protein
MKILVDTSVWSLALRREGAPHDPCVIELRGLIKELRVQMIGPVRQEILSGIKSKSQFLKLRQTLRAFPDLELTSQDYELAAEFFNVGRKRGIQGSNTGFLICAISKRHEMPIFATDKDFVLFRKHLPITLYAPRSYR